MLTGERDVGDGGFLWVVTTHIIPEATNKNIGQVGKKQFPDGGVWTILLMFTDVNIVEDLGGKRIHGLENIMSMELSCHAALDELFVWLKPVEGSPHTYRVCEARQGHKMILRTPDVVTFTTASEYPLPDPAYLALHALRCKVAWTSGEYLMDMERGLVPGGRSLIVTSRGVPLSLRRNPPNPNLATILSFGRVMHLAGPCFK
ncbi:hypothetical protein J3R82DRAFT_7636 [Butyriboletus roseoflavus]|nr:hypothetical protein J3R82DRAFT_7636 [Butyriboletus roseoflavus]